FSIMCPDTDTLYLYSLSLHDALPISRYRCVSEYENVRPCNILSSEKSIPSTSTPVPKAACSICAWKSTGFSSSTNRPTGNQGNLDRKSTRLNSSHVSISYAVFCLQKK